MKILVACEFSGIVRDAFINKGYNAVSCDLRETESRGPHYKGDVMNIINEDWDLMIAHPPCTYLCNSGVRWLHERDGRWKKMKKASKFFRSLLEANIPHIAVENPIMHKYAIKEIGHGRQDQCIQPYHFGEPQSKSICLWLKNLPKLEKTNIIDNYEQKVHKMGPSDDRSKKRSLFFPKVAKAMANQWGEYVENKLKQPI